MVELVRQGVAIREVARRYRVAPNTVRRWVTRGHGLALRQVDWSDRSRAPHRVHNRTPLRIEQRVLACRRQLAAPANALGFVGADTIFETLQSHGEPVPSPRTITRILKRYGALDRQPRRRFPAPPVGWSLPDLAQQVAELEAFDIIEGLVLEGRGELEVLTGIALWGPQVEAWPAPTITARAVGERLVAHWRAVGLPTYAQFDNDTRFQGGHNHPDVIGRVARICLSLDIIPVFTPPRETGFQAAVEHFNGLWQSKVWHRMHHEALPLLQERSQRFTAAYTRRRARRVDWTPPRRPFPPAWQLDLQAPPRGRLIDLRRTDEHGAVSLLGRRFAVDALWPHRLVRCVVDLDHHCLHVFRLRRRAPQE